MDIFVARQPILDRKQNVFGYELLFRSGPENFFSHSDVDEASSRVISDSLHVFGLDKLTAGKRAFINISRRVLVDGLVTVLPKQSAVVEILETVDADEEVIAACRSLKRAGYLIALDDFEMRTGSEPLIALADVIKIDFVATPPAQRQALARNLSSHNVRLLAEKVETREEFTEAMQAGFAYFQGYFFCRPEVVSQREIPAIKRNYLLFLQEVNRPDIDSRRLEPIIRQDVALTVKLLRYLNSVFFGLKTQITSVQQALVILGEQAIRRWASLIALTCIGHDKPAELVVISLIRGRFCELLGPLMRPSRPAEDLFLMGMLSAIDALVDHPLSELLVEMPVSLEIKAALLGSATPLGKLYALVRDYEKGEWESVAGLCAELGIDEAQVPEIYSQSVEWADSVFRA